jgi:hypothetical protein
VDAESKRLRRRPPLDREESSKSTDRSHRGIGDGMSAKEQRVNTGSPTWRGECPQLEIREDRDQAALGDGEVRSSNETSNDRGAKGPGFRVKVKALRGRNIDASLPSRKSSEEAEALYVEAKMKEPLALSS